jgi:hypothetical protein
MIVWLLLSLRLISRNCLCSIFWWFLIVWLCRVWLRIVFSLIPKSSSHSRRNLILNRLSCLWSLLILTLTWLYYILKRKNILSSRLSLVILIPRWHILSWSWLINWYLLYLIYLLFQILNLLELLLLRIKNILLVQDCMTKLFLIDCLS